MTPEERREKTLHQERLEAFKSLVVFTALALTGLPSLTPRRVAAASAAFVRVLIASASCSATAARMWIVRRF